MKPVAAVVLGLVLFA